MEPLPEVRAVASELSALGDDVDFLGGLRVMSQLAQVLVPSVVGVSLTVVVDGEAFTMTATSPEMATLDAAQYLGGGPCLAAALDRREVNLMDVLDEGRWHVYAQAATASGVRASLSIPVGATQGEPPAALNLYATEPAAFEGKEQLLANAFGASADDLITNADLSFRTRQAARRLPQQVEERARLDNAVGILIAARGWTAEEARERLLTASYRADAPIDSVVQVILSLHLD